MIKTCRVIICLLCCGITYAVADTTVDAVRENCARCHGEDGVALQPGMPHLNGQQDTYLIDIMTRYQRGRLITEVPNHVAKSLDADQIDTIARFYAESKAVRPKQEIDPDKVARGEVVYRNRCADCHVDNGREADKDAPFIAAQNLDYLLKQTRYFVTGKRKFGFLQDEAFKGVSDDELESAIHFFASQEQYAPKVVGKKKRH